MRNFRASEWKSSLLHSERSRKSQITKQCGNSSVGRAQPCPQKKRCQPWQGGKNQIKIYAEIAQLVEHNLAKVGVASSSLVFRSPLGCSNGGMVDTRDLKSLGHCGCAGSSPASSTRKPFKQNLKGFSFYVYLPQNLLTTYGNRWS